MNWIFIGILYSTLMTSAHDTKEACLGREAVLKEKGVIGKCVEAPTSGSYLSNGLLICNGGICK